MQPPSYDKMMASHAKGVADQRERALSLYEEIMGYVGSELDRTGADVALIGVGTVLPKITTDGPLAMRFDVTPTTVLWARQAHSVEEKGDKHRSIPIDLATCTGLPANVASGLTRIIEKVAEMQGRSIDRPQGLSRFRFCSTCSRRLPSSWRPIPR